MKRITSLLGILAMITVFLSCSKKDNQLPTDAVYSYWTVNSDTIAYSNIVVNSAPILTELRVISLPLSESGLSFAFQMGSLPHSGTYKVDYVGSGPKMCNVYVDYNGATYNVDPMYNTTTIKVSTLSNGKGKYALEPTWFYRDLVPSDSILVEGVIVEP
ncbi:hypothetical protein [Taibaiella koreensis]|uniref:hypothetical protein n=1 Tax=Taibaiella koreensis TaxID=1268548 RepID=UPI0013C2D888|nr:hypothetical protein [Taibaiella koreensis]